MPAYSGPDCDLAPDPAAISDFVNWWFEKTNRGVIEIGWLDAAGRGLIHFEQFDRTDTAALAATAVQANLVPGQACYIRAATVMPWGNDANRGRTSDMDFEQAPGIWSDIDKPEDFERAKTIQTIVRPNGSVITGTVPHHRVQSWFRTSEPIVSADLVRSLNVRLHKLYGGDEKVVNPSRLMRLPGTIAWPWKEGRQPEVTQFIRPGPGDNRPSSYPLSMLTSQLPRDDEQEQERPHVNGHGSAETFGFGSMSTVASLIAAIKAGREWHNHMIQLVAHWVGQGRSTVEIMGHCEGWTMSGFTHDQTRREVAKAIEGARQKWQVPDVDPTLGGASAPEAFPATPLESLDLDNIPPRQWVYGRELVRGFVSVLASTGGTGKTAYTMVSGVSVALARSLFHPGMGEVPAHLRVHKSGPVWFYNLEDPQDELRRRIKATLQHHKVSREALTGKIFLDSGRDRPLVVAVRVAGVGLVQAPVLVPLIAELKLRQISVLIIDPFVQSHGAEENRNEEMNLVMAAWGRVANEANCAVWLVHHFRKGGQGGDAEAVRGAAAIQGAARSMHTLSTMTMEEAASLGVPPEDRWQFIRHDNVKQNMAPVAGKAIWFQLVSVELGNITEDYPEGDSVQTVAAWSLPTPWEGLTWDKIEVILREIDLGCGDGEFYAMGKQAKDRWAGHVVMEHASKGASQIVPILAAWKEAGLLEIGEYMSRKLRRTSECVRVNQAKFSEMIRSQMARNVPDDY